MGIKFGLWDGALDGDGPCAPAECVFKDTQNNYESCVKCGGPKYEKPGLSKEDLTEMLGPQGVFLQNWWKDLADMNKAKGPKKEFTKQAADAKAAKKFPSLEQITPMLLTDETKKAIAEVVAKKFAEDTKVSSPENISKLLAKDGENLSKLLANQGSEFWKNLMEDAVKKWKGEAVGPTVPQWISCKHEWKGVVTCAGGQKGQCKDCGILVSEFSMLAFESCPGHSFSQLFSSAEPPSRHYICGPCAVIVEVPEAVTIKTNKEPITLVSKATEKMVIPMKGFGKDLEHFNQKILAGLQLPADAIAPSHGCSPATHNWQLKVKNAVSGGWSYRCKECKKDVNACLSGTHNWTKWNDTSVGPIYVCTKCGISNQAPMTEAVNTAPAEPINVDINLENVKLKVKAMEEAKELKKKEEAKHAVMGVDLATPAKNVEITKKTKAALAVNPEKVEKIKKIMEASKIGKKVKAGKWSDEELEEVAGKVKDVLNLSAAAAKAMAENMAALKTPIPLQLTLDSNGNPKIEPTPEGKKKLVPGLSPADKIFSGHKKYNIVDPFEKAQEMEEAKELSGLAKPHNPEEAMLPLGTNSPEKPIPGDNDFFNLAQIIAKAKKAQADEKYPAEKLAGSGNPTMSMGATMADLCKWEDHIWHKNEDSNSYVCTTCGSTHTTQDDIPGGKQACEHVEVWKGKMADGGTACLRCGITLQLGPAEIKEIYKETGAVKAAEATSMVGQAEMVKQAQKVEIAEIEAAIKAKQAEKETAEAISKNKKVAIKKMKTAAEVKAALGEILENKPSDIPASIVPGEVQVVPPSMYDQPFPPNQLEQEPPTGYKYPVQEASTAEIEKFEKGKQKNCNHAWVDAGTHRVFCNRCQLLHPVVGICREHFNPSTVSTILEMGERDLVIGALINQWREGMASWSDVLCKIILYLGEALDLAGPHKAKNPLEDAPKRNLLLGKK